VKVEIQLDQILLNMDIYLLDRDGGKLGDLDGEKERDGYR
jgi:hypothetical protein